MSFNQVISTTNFILLHMMLTTTTSKVSNNNTSGTMKKGPRLSNVASEGVIDEDALLLVRALDGGSIAQVIFRMERLCFCFFY